jgi:hypothetical protein
MWRIFCVRTIWVVGGFGNYVMLRRYFLLILAVLLLVSANPRAQGGGPLSRFDDIELGVSVSLPESWTRVDRSGTVRVSAFVERGSLDHWSRSECRVSGSIDQMSMGESQSVLNARIEAAMPMPPGVALGHVRGFVPAAKAVRSTQTVSIDGRSSLMFLVEDPSPVGGYEAQSLILVVLMVTPGRNWLFQCSSTALSSDDAEAAYATSMAEFQQFFASIRFHQVW